MHGAANGAVENSTFARHHLQATDFHPNKWGHPSLLAARHLKVRESPSIIKTTEYLCDHAI